MRSKNEVEVLLSSHGCGCCHTCGTPLHLVLDGEEWCPKCKAYRRYRSHGWSWRLGTGETECPSLENILGADCQKATES